MKHTGILLGAIVLAAGLFCFPSCSKQKNEKILYLYNWTYYTPDSVIRAFEQEFKCTVKLDSYSTNEEMYAKLRAGAKGYDIVVPSNDFVSIMIKQNMLRELDQKKLTNRDKINPIILEKATYDPDMKYAVPYALSVCGISVNKTKVPEGSYERTWNIFTDPQFKGHATLMDDMRDVMGDALTQLGYSVNSTDKTEIKAAADLILNKWKPNIVKFDAEGFGKSFAAGDFWLCQGYPEIVFGEVPEEKWDSTIDFFIPEAGGPSCLDSMCILKDAPHYELANEFINFIHNPQMYAKFLDAFRYPCCVNLEAQQYVTKKPMYDADQAYSCTLKLDLGDDLDKYHEQWQRVRFAE